MARLSEYSDDELDAMGFDTGANAGAPIAADVGIGSAGIAREFSDRYGRHSHWGADRAVDVYTFPGVDLTDSLAINLGYVGRHREQLDTWYRFIHKAPDTGAVVRILDIGNTRNRPWSGNLELLDAPVPYAPTALGVI